MPRTMPRRDARVTVRLTPEERDFILRAASIETNGDVSRFVASAAAKMAKVVIHEHGVSQVNDQMRVRFYDVLLNPPKPTEELVALAAKHVPDGFELE